MGVVVFKTVIGMALMVEKDEEQVFEGRLVWRPPRWTGVE